MVRNERGQVLPLVALFVVVMGSIALAVVRLGVVASDRARASAAADAAALAGAADGPDAARRLAVANQGRVLAYEEAGDDVQVRVAVGQASATARATRTGGDGSDEDPGLRAALARARQLLGRPVPVARFVAGGRAVDVVTSAAADVAGVGAEAGLCQSDPTAQPARFALCPPPGAGGDAGP